MKEKQKKPIKELKFNPNQGQAGRQNKGGGALDKMQARAERFLEVDEELPLSMHVILWSAFLAVIVFLIWAYFAPLDEVTRGDGKVIPSMEAQKISSLEGGIVKEFHVKEGDEVEKGQLLVVLDDIGASSDYGSNRQRYLGLRATVARLQAEVEGTLPEFPEEVMQEAPGSVSEELRAFSANQEKISNQTSIMEQQRSQRRQELNELTIRASDIRGQLALIEEEKAMVKPLVDRGSAPQMELLQLDRQIKEKQTELNGVNAGIPRANSAIREAEERIREVKTTATAQAQTELAAKQNEMNAIYQILTGQQDIIDRKEIRSPVDGYLQDLKVNTVGGVVQPGQEFIEITPKDDKLIVEARIKPKDIAFIYADQLAVVKITAYDFSIYGGLKGQVIKISPDAITDENGESFYRVSVQTKENALERKGERLPIIPGMVASVDILTGEKTVMEYILKPFVKTLDKAMNER